MGHKKIDSVRVGKLVLTQSEGIYTVSAMVDGEPLWFQSTEPLRIAPEGFAGALLIPAMHLGRALNFEDALCATWLDNARRLMAIYQQWWGWSPVEIQSSSNAIPEPYTGSQTGLCFSAGVDSFYSIDTYPKPIHSLVTVHGYDIALDDEAGAASVVKNSCEIANHYAVKSVVIKTNLREHSIARKRYRESFEGALAAIAYVVEGMSTLVISSDYSRDALRHFHHGSDWRTAPLRSGAGINIIHYGDHYSRDEKIRQIAGNKLFPKYLRVCQQNLTTHFNLGGQYLNCGVCDKCLRTLIPLTQTVGLEHFECFANTKNFYRHVNRINWVASYACVTYEKFCVIGVEPALNSAIRALVWRSRFFHKRDWLGRRGKMVLGLVFRCIEKLKQFFVVG